MGDVRAQLIRELLAAGTPLDDARTWMGPAEEIAQFVELFENSTEARMYMTIARRVGRPLKKVMAEWSDWEDVVAEFGWTVLQAEEALRTCPECGIDHDDVRDPDDLRPLEHGRYKLEKIDCWVKAEEERAKKNRLTEEEEKAGVRFHLRLRAAGDPWIDDGTGTRED